MNSLKRLVMEQQLQLAFDMARRAGMNIEKFELSPSGRIAIFCKASCCDQYQSGGSRVSALDRWLASENVR